MLYFLKFIFSFLSPPGIWILLLIPFVWLTYKNNRRMSVSLGLITLLIYICSVPLVADTMIRSIENDYLPPEQFTGDVIVMLAGGTFADTPGIAGPGNPHGETSGRIITTAALYNRYQLPVIVSGGQVYADYGVESEIARNSLLAIGIPEEKIIIEQNSRSTEENAKFVKEILQNKGYFSPILVTSALHLPRSVQLFESKGVFVIPYPTGYMSNSTIRFDISKLLPSYEAVNLTGHAIKERIGLLLLLIDVSI